MTFVKWLLVVIAFTVWCLLLMNGYLWTYNRRRLDYSVWMICTDCKVKWRPSFYGLADNEDFTCPECDMMKHSKVLVHKHSQRSYKHYRKVRKENYD